MRFRRLLLGSLAATSMVSVADRAMAQDTDDAAFGDIVVTAQKRDENLQDVPVSVSAYTAEFRDQTGIISTQDQMNFTPGVVYSQTADRVAIRGVGRQTNTIGTDPGVAIYNDGFYQPNLTDVGGSTLGTARIEVLRGPQGTLYGRNSIGGAINVISVRPSDEFEGEVRAAYNDYGRVTLEGRVAGPLSFNSRGSLQVFSAEQDEGYYDNLLPGMPDEGGVVDTWFAEGQWAVDVTDRFDVWLRLRAAEYDNRDRSSAMISPYDPGYSLENVPTPTFDLGPGQLNIPNPGVTDNRTFLSDRALSNYLDDYYLFVTEMNYRFDAFDVKYIGGWQQMETGYSVDGEQGPSLGFNWELSNDWYNYALAPYSPNAGPFGGYLFLSDLQPGQASGVTIPITGDVETWGTDDRDVWSHEINISSSGDGPLQWLFGLYYYQEQYTQNFHITFPNEPVFDTVYPITVNPLVLLIQLNTNPLFAGLTHAQRAAILYGAAWAVENGLVPPTAVPNTTRDGYGTIGQLEVRSSAAFAQFDYDFSDTLHATFGIRYSHDEKYGTEQERIPAWYPFLIPAGTPLDLNADGVADMVAPADQVVNYVSDAGPNFLQGVGIHDNSWNHMTGTAGLQWTPSDDMMFYASYSHGYKAGGFTLGPFKPDVNPETIDAVELGWKLNFGPRIQFNGAIFHYNYHDLQTIIQTPVTGGATAQLINLNETRTRGIELEGLWAPTDNFRLMANYSYNDAEILSACCFLDDADPFAGPQNLAGARVPFSPEHKAALNATYSWFFEPGELSASATVNYRSDSYYTVFNTSNWLMEGYTTTDFRVRWADSEDRYAIIGTVANAFDEDAVQSFTTTNPQTSSQQSIGLQPPRIWSIEFQYRF